MADDASSVRRLPIRVEDDAVWARQIAIEVAAETGLSRRQQVEVGIAVSEMVTNAARHGGTGLLTLRRLDDGIEVSVEDAGPGIDDVAAAFEDGVSKGIRREPGERLRPGQGLGAGLGAVRRLMDGVDVSRSVSLGGTCITARKRRTPAAPSR